MPRPIGKSRLLAAMFLLSCLVACGSPPRQPHPAMASHRDTKLESLRPRLKTPVDACDNPKRGRECVRAALQNPHGSEQFNSALTRACKAGYAPGCYFLESGPLSDEEKVTYARRACAFGLKRACTIYLSALEKREQTGARTPVAGPEERWIARTTRLVLEEPSSVELIAHPGSRVALLDVDGDTAFALLTAFATSECGDKGDPLTSERDDVHECTG